MQNLRSNILGLRPFLSACSLPRTICDGNLTLLAAIKIQERDGCHRCLVFRRGPVHRTSTLRKGGEEVENPTILGTKSTDRLHEMRTKRT